MKNILSTLLCFSALAMGYTQTTIKSNSKDGRIDWIDLTGKDYYIQYPETWELKQAGAMGVEFILLAPFDYEGDIFKENVNLMVQDLSKLKMNLDQFVALSEEQIDVLITNSKLIESKRVKTKKEEYHSIMYAGSDHEKDFLIKQNYWVKKDKAYVLTFCSEEKNYPIYEEISNEIFNSFILKK